MLSGGIGSGKSTVAAMLQGLGAQVFDADAVSRALTAAGGQAMPLIVAAFGERAQGADGALDRAWMRQLVFSQPESRHALESILHPLIGQQADQLDRATGSGALVFDIPLLKADSPWRHRAHRVLVVDCSEHTQVQRVMQRSGLNEQEVRRVMASQISRAQRRALADAVIHNEELSLTALQDSVAALWDHWCSAG